jgi:hypothetical protein
MFGCVEEFVFQPPVSFPKHEVGQLLVESGQRTAIASIVSIQHGYAFTPKALSKRSNPA